METWAWEVVNARYWTIAMPWKVSRTVVNAKNALIEWIEWIEWSHGRDFAWLGIATRHGIVGTLVSATNFVNADPNDLHHHS